METIELLALIVLYERVWIETPNETRYLSI
jgi:hypothetical protein